MFQTSYQSGQFFELFDPKANRDNDKVYRMVGPTGFHRSYDKDLKGNSQQDAGYILEVEDNKAQLPRDEKLELCLLQQYLHLQLWVEPTANFTLELIMSDTVKVPDATTQTKRRIVLANTISKTEVKPFLTRLSSKPIQCGCWVNVCFSLNGFVMASKGQKYRSLEGMSVAGTYKLRRIFTTKSILIDFEGKEFDMYEQKQSSVPRHLRFPQGIPNRTIVYHSEDKIEEVSSREDGSLNASHSKEDRRNQFSTPRQSSLSKHNINKSLEEKHFLANTANITETVMRLKHNDRSLHQSKAEQSTKESAGHLPHSNSRIKEHSYSVDKKTTNRFLKRSPVPLVRPPAKPNPWRTNDIKEQEADDRGIMSAQLKKTQRKDKLPPNNQLLKKQEVSSYSDSDYFELSQKFSTVTDLKVLKVDSAATTKLRDSRNHYHQDEQEQIEQAIEMENSQSSHIRQTERVQQEPGRPASTAHKTEESLQQTQQGFRQQHMKRFFEEVQRPYTPSVTLHEQMRESVKTNVNNREVELVYDPVLNCYFDYKTNTYYEMKS